MWSGGRGRGPRRPPRPPLGQEAPRRAQEAPQDGLRGPQDGPRGPHDGPRGGPGSLAGGEKFWRLALRFLSRKPMIARGLCRVAALLPCFWLLPRGDGRGRPGSLGLSGATTRHFVAHAPTSHAVWGITKPYISSCLGNYEALHFTLCGESTVSRRW